MLVVHMFPHVIFTKEAFLAEAALEGLDAGMSDAMTAHIGCVGEGLHANIADEALAILRVGYRSRQAARTTRRWIGPVFLTSIPSIAVVLRKRIEFELICYCKSVSRVVLRGAQSWCAI